jgi:hypothetical protein
MIFPANLIRLGNLESSVDQWPLKITNSTKLQMIITGTSRGDI